MTSHQTLARLSERLLEDVHALYRTLRAAPELSMQEHRTAALIQQRGPRAVASAPGGRCMTQFLAGVSLHETMPAAIAFWGTAAGVLPPILASNLV